MEATTSVDVQIVTIVPAYDLTVKTTGRHWSNVQFGSSQCLIASVLVYDPGAMNIRSPMDECIIQW